MAPVAANLPMPAFQGISARLMILDGVSCRLEAPFIMAGPAIDHPSSESRLPRMRILMASAATLVHGLRSPCTLRIVTVSTLQLTMLPLQWIACSGMVERLGRYCPEIINDVTIGARFAEPACMGINMTLRAGLEGDGFEAWNQPALGTGQKDAPLDQMAFFAGDAGMFAG